MVFTGSELVKIRFRSKIFCYVIGHNVINWLKVYQISVVHCGMFEEDGSVLRRRLFKGAISSADVI